MITQRTQWIKIEQALKQDKIIDFDIRFLRTEAFLFYNLLIKQSDSFDNLMDLLKARTHLDNCLIFSKSNLEPERNEYIAQINKSHESYKGFVAYIGIANARLDTAQESLDSIDRKSRINEIPIEPIKIENFKQLLIEYMYNLVLVPYLNAVRKFRDFEPKPDKEGKIIVKDRDLFFYFLFLEYFHASEVIGALARQMALSNKLTGLKATEMQSVRAPPQFPSDVRKMEYVEPQATQDINSFDVEDYLKSEGDEEEVIF